MFPSSGNNGFPTDVDVVCVCGWCKYDYALFGRRRVLLNLKQLLPFSELKQRLKRFHFVRAFFSNDCLMRPTVQKHIVATDTPPPAYWSNVSLYGNFVVDRLDKKVAELLLLANTTNNRLKLADCLRLRVKLCTKHGVETAVDWPMEWTVKVVGAAGRAPTRAAAAKKPCRCRAGRCTACVCHARNEWCSEDCHGGNVNLLCKNCPYPYQP